MNARQHASKQPMSQSKIEENQQKKNQNKTWWRWKQKCDGLKIFDKRDWREDCCRVGGH